MNGFRNSEENQQTTDKRVRHYTSKTYPLLNNAVFSLEAATIFKNFCFSCSLIVNNLTSDIVKSVRQTRSAKKGEGDDTRSVVLSGTRSFSILLPILIGMYFQIGVVEEPR